MSALVVGCSAKEDSAGAGTGAASGAGGTSGAGGSGTGGTSGTSGTGGTSGTSGTGGTSGTSGAGGASGASGMGSGGMDMVPPGEMTKEERYPDVQDWAALDIVYDHGYTANDGMHDFKVPFHVMGTEVGLDAWFAIPADAVTFDEDPDLASMGGGVIVTINVAKFYPEITIGVQAGNLGGTAPLTVTEAEPADWEMGEARYDNGNDYDFPELTPDQFAMLLLDPSWSPPAPPDNCSCISCHSSNAKYFEIQHTPTQAARFSDEQLNKIMTMGMKPEGVGFRVLPDMLGDKSNVQLYEEFHTWTGSEEELRGLIVYLRSLTPTGQGDIKLPDGTYVAPGSEPPPP